MRTAIVIFAAVALWCGTDPVTVATDKSEKDRRKELQEMMVEKEKEAEKTEEVKKLRQHLTELRKHLEEADRIDLFKLKHVHMWRAIQSLACIVKVQMPS